MVGEGKILIKGAKVHNLKNITLEIPRNRFVVITGLSGSGKSSLAMNTLFAEGQRRFAESLSSYARQFLGRMSKPDVESIEGIPPAIAIEQKVNIRNPRSTVATTTEIYDYLRLVYSKIGHTFSPVSGREVRRHSASDVIRSIVKGDSGTVYILSPLSWDEREDKVELMLKLKADGYTRFFMEDGGLVRIEDVLMKAGSGEYPANLLLMVDRLKLPLFRDGYPYSEDGTPWPQDKWDDLRTRLYSSVGSAFREGDGKMLLMKDGGMEEYSDRFEMDGITFREPDEYLFSFNSPLGACPVCGGLGLIIGVSEDLVIPDKTLSIYDGAIACWRGEQMGWFRKQLVKCAQKYGIPIFEPYAKLSPEVRKLIWENRSVKGDEETFVGLNEFFEWVESNRYKIQYKYMLSRFTGRTTCSSCHGTRLRQEALYVKVGGKNIAELLSMTVDRLIDFFENLDLAPYELSIAKKPLEEIMLRLRCIRDVGLSYLTLDRACKTLSGGESQRISLVKALGSSLVGSMYILDEPSIGLHPCDTRKLIGVIRRLRDIGNTVVVVEHDEEIIKAADMLIDMGPLAGSGGGQIVFQGNLSQPLPKEAIDSSLTLQYVLGGRRRYRRQKRTWTYSITVKGAMEHNLKGMDVKFPLDVMTVVCGVSGSGKSSLVGDILYPAMSRRINQKGDLPGTFKGLAGNLDRITRIEYVDQNPIGNNSRSNPVTYLKVYDDIRKLFSEQQFARINGFTPSFFSFNQEGGRCPECLGEGFVRIPMQFMADVTTVCESCGGKRFKPDILEVRYNGKNIHDILNMSVAEAIEFFGSRSEDLPRQIASKLQPLVDVGLSYIKLGQSTSNLSGGESQRIKLAYFLSLSRNASREQRRERILFIFDEPTTGLHFHDVETLMKAFDALLEGGHTVIVVEHNLDVIESADWVIEIGPEAGDKGGEAVFEGTPEDLAATGETHTAVFLRNNRP